MTSPRRRLGEIASTLLFENDRVRIWETKLAPGTDGPVHRHGCDHVLVQISGDRIAVVPEPDTRGPYDTYQEADVVPGNVFFVPRGGIERARNVGRQTFHEIVVELKD
jgi:quercetin dioxygenase-like cupin family protein